ncbi:MAG TPA: ABC transporter permease [Bacillota bacterium]|nr:ABC transporter permease [Bacillota bacterium]
MRTLGVLLWKDVRRTWRNPAGWLVFLAIPLVITALIGLVFGPKSTDAALGRIRFAVVDEDNSPLTRFLRGGINQGEGSKYLEPVFLSRAEALAQVHADKLSAMLVIPAGFTRAYLTSTNVVSLELVKNPAQSIHPAVLEELLGALVTALDALKRNFGSDLPPWQALFDGQGDHHQVAELIIRAGDKVQAVRKVCFPPRVTYSKVKSDSPAPPAAAKGQSNSAKAARAKPAFNIFGYLLPGLAAMFLLFLAENASRDVQQEMRQLTLQRFRTLHQQLYSFVASKVLFCLVFLVLSSAVMLGGGGLLFHISWRDPLAVIVLTASYCLFASGLMTLLPTLLGNQRSSQALANVAAMMLGLAGGSAFPAEQLPGFLRHHITPLMPNYWYAEAMRAVAFHDHPAPWLGVALRTALLGAGLMLAAAFLLRRSLERGTCK